MRSSRREWLGRAWDVIGTAMAVALLVFVGRWGWERRATLWTETAPIRFHGDIENARAQARTVLRLAASITHPNENPDDVIGKLTLAETFEGYRAIYDWHLDRPVNQRVPNMRRRDAMQLPPNDRPPIYELDYPPMRMAVMTLWTWNNARSGELDRHYAADMTEPLRDFNASMMVIACGAALLLVHTVRRKMDSHFGTSILLGAIAASLLWANPAVMINGHAWPQWDVWVIPGTLVPLYLAYSGRWALAGAALTFFGMFKGQIFLAAIPLAVWPIVSLQLGSVLRLACGALCGAGAVVWVWLVKDTASFTWIVTAGLAAVPIMLWPKRHRGGTWWAIAGSLAALTIVGPALRLTNASLLTSTLLVAACVCVPALTTLTRGVTDWTGRTMSILVVVGALALLGSLWFARFELPLFMLAAWACVALPLSSLFMKHGRLALAFGTSAVALLFVGLALDGSWAWVDVGFPTNRHMGIALGTALNLPVLLSSFYNWRIEDPTLDAGWLFGYGPAMTFRTTLITASLVLLMLNGIALAIHHKRRDPRFLAAAALPWAIVYLLNVQMHERYLLYVAASTVLLVGMMPVAGTLMHAAFTFFSAILMLTVMIRSGGVPRDWQHMLEVMQPMQPSASFATVTLGAVLLVMAFGYTRRLPALEPIKEPRVHRLKKLAKLRRAVGRSMAVS
ncbi:MAG: hypothetical protein QM770_05395 [Tepidisphaeraceae bacterium]